MNREFRFRVWDGKYMLYPNKDSEIAFAGDEPVMNVWSQGGEHLYKVEIKELMQYSGIKDREGVEIFEGDICQIHYYHSLEVPSVIGVVEWIKTGFSIRAVKNIDEKALTGIYSLDFRSGGNFGDTPAVEVIGNIYENPEILK
jgi:uncharacterized phage protein (TIGR01671 family)